MDKKVDAKEFWNMYKRCIIDKSGLEPKSLFNMVQFLMYCKPGVYLVTVEDTLELLYVRLGKDNLYEKIEDLFGKEKETIEWQEKEITFAEYLERVTKKAIEQRKEKLKEKSQMYNTFIRQKDDSPLKTHSDFK